jgi:hypothetical protein
MKRDAIDELAAELFAAARDERPDRELIGRIERSAAGGPGTAPERGAAVERFRAAAARNVACGPSRSFRWLLAAAVFAGVAVVVASRLEHDDAKVTLSAEHSPASERRSDATPSVARLPSVQAPLEPPRAAASHEVDPARPELAPSPPRTTPEIGSPPGRERREPSPAAPGREARTPASPPGASPPSGPPPLASTPKPQTPAATPPEGPARAAVDPSANTLASELALVKQVRSALRGHDGATALTLLDRYDTGAHGRALAVEATLLRVEALDAVGRRAEASALARRFVAENPDSPLAERAQSFIVDGSAPAAKAPRPEPPSESSKPGP